DANNIQQYFSDQMDIQHSGGLHKIGKYYTRFDEKLVYILALVLHPYYKLDYIKMACGVGPEEQAAERALQAILEQGTGMTKALQVVEGVMVDYWNELMTAEDV
ncbi:hypothetical protein BU15DRAFT_69670, partial [Melanogaster broomeanus]